MYKQCRGLFQNLLSRLRALVSQVSPGRKILSPGMWWIARPRLAGMMPGTTTKQSSLCPLLSPSLTSLPAFLKQQTIKQRAKLFCLSPETPGLFFILRLQAQFFLMTYISPIKPDYYQHLYESHFRCNLTLYWGLLCLHYGKPETLLWSFFHISKGKEQKILQAFSDKITCCQQCYRFSKDTHSKIHLQCIPAWMC